MLINLFFKIDVFIQKVERLESVTAGPNVGIS